MVKRKNKILNQKKDEMEKMKAYARMNANTQEVELIDVSIPDILSDEVLVKIEAFGVGIHDRYFIPANARFPYVIGSEGSGKIVNTGNQVNRFSSGERVIFTTVLQPQGGTWAEFAAAKRSALIHLPDEISFETGATVPIRVELRWNACANLN